MDGDGGIHFRENTVEYEIYIPSALGKDAKQMEELKEWRNKLLTDAVYLEMTKEYLWQHAVDEDGCEQECTLEIRPSNVPHLYGSIVYGDCVEDAWVVVWLLFHWSKRWNVIVRVFDNDGQFLLIESADSIPSWVRPENADYRVFVWKGRVHLLPLPSSPSELASLPIKLDATKALQALVELPTAKTIASKAVQKDILQRMQGYPAKALEISTHYARVIVPWKVGRVLEHHPKWVTAAVQAVMERDPLDMRACDRMRHFSVDSPMALRVRFTRCLYAQLTSQHIVPPRAFRKRTQILPTDHVQQVAEEVGMKLACGMEMLLSREQDGEELGWRRHKRKLVRLGYFLGEKEGSHRYQELEQEARQAYNKDQKVVGSVRAKVEGWLSVCDRPTRTLDAMWNALEVDDPTDWMHISAKELDVLMRERGTLEGTKTVHDAVHGLQEFVHTMADYEGAQMGGEEDEAIDPIEFSEHGVLEALRKALEGEEVDDEPSVQEYQHAMDEELRDTVLTESFPRKDAKSDEDEFAPVDIDLNVVQALIGAADVEGGDAGPWKGLMGALGMGLPEK